MHGIRLLVTPTLLVKVGKLTKTQVTTACIDLKTDLTNGRKANWAPELVISPSHMLLHFDFMLHWLNIIHDES